MGAGRAWSPRAEPSVCLSLDTTSFVRILGALALPPPRTCHTSACGTQGSLQQVVEAGAGGPGPSQQRHSDAG